MSSRNNHNVNGHNDIVSWVITIICLISPLWPLGLFLLLRKISFNKKRGADTPGSGAARQNTAWQAKPWQTQSWQRPRQAYPDQARPWQTGQGGAQVRQNSGTYYAAPPPQQSARQQHSGASAAPAVAGGKKTRDSKAEKKQLPGKGLIVILTLSAVLLSLLGIGFLSGGLGSAAVTGLTSSNLGLSIIGGFSILGGIISAITRGFVVKRSRRFKTYAAVVGNRRVMAVDDIAKVVGETVPKAQKTLQMMVDAGIFGPSAYIDNELDSLVLSFEDAEKAHKARQAAQATSSENNNPYVAVVNELHMLCAGTSDPVISGKIQRIEDVTVKIFRLVEEKPEKAPQIRRFMNYYLPTTLKLLHSYETLEKQGVGGENISAAKNDIVRVLDTLAAGFEQQLDNLFQSDKIDISADIDVLENLMRQDGLTDSGNIMRASDGSIVKDPGRG